MPLIEDRRLAIWAGWSYVSEGEGLVQVPDEILKCVAFIACQEENGSHLRATAFFVGESLPGTDLIAQWLVTGAHVINHIEAKSTDQVAHVRVNTKAGGTTWVNIPVAAWTKHPSEDVAITAGAILPSFDHLRFPLPGREASANGLRSDEIGPGDEVFLPGLFVNHAGSKRNIPIIRVGNIAAMPGEPIILRDWGKMVAYLVEARSIGGLSGAPVFVHGGNIRSRGGSVSVVAGPPTLHPLGLMHGHFDSDGLTDADVTDEAEKVKERVNMGIAVVVPLAAIYDTFDLPFLAAQREATQRKWIEDHAPTPDVASDVPVESPLTNRAEFEKALRRVSRRKASPPDGGTSET